MDAISIYTENDLTAVEMNVDAIADAADLNWEVIKKPALFYDAESKLKPSTKSFLFLNKDGEQTELDIVGGDFKPLQPKQLISTFLKLSTELGLKLISAGHTRNGKHIYLIASLDDNVEVDDLNFKKCLFFSTSNDGNAKTKITPICINEDVNCQITQSRAPKQKEDSYTLSHHFEFDVFEATQRIKENYERWDTFFDDIEMLGNVPANKDTITDFHHRIYQRFTIGNASTIRKYEIVMHELWESYEKTNAILPPKKQGTLLAAFLSFCEYIDFSKHRKGGFSGKVHSINFAADELTKRTALYLCKDIAAKLISAAHSE